VRIGQEDLRYPRRYGPQAIYLAEAEVANAYRSRFLEAASQVAQLDNVLRDGLEAIRPPRMQDDPTAWIVVALVPNNLGTIDLRVGALSAFEEWVRTGGSHFDTPFLGRTPQASTGVRRITVSAWIDSRTGRPQEAYGEFHSDGSGVVATRLQLIGGASDYGQQELAGVSDEALVVNLTGMVALLVDHAVGHAGVHGDAVACATLLGPRSPADGQAAADQPITLLHNRQFGIWQPLPRSRPLATFPVSQHTISLDSVAANVQERLVAVRLLLTDVVQGFGFPEVLQIHPDGTLRRRYWGGIYRDIVTQWAEAKGVEQVDTTVDQEA
jgi:hypothetical protein